MFPFLTVPALIIFSVPITFLYFLFLGVPTFEFLALLEVLIIAADANFWLNR
jgi:hypothetical protein